MPTSLRARFIIPVDQPPIPGGVVTYHGERIIAVDTRPATANVIDLGDVALLPGFVNAHTHLEFSYLPQPLGQPGMSIVDWIRLVIAERNRGDASRSSGFVHGHEESRAAGVTTIADISTAEVPSPCDVAFCEVIGFSRARSESALNSLLSKIGLSSRHDAAAPVPRRLGISPHAPYTVSPQLLSKLVSLATTHRLPMAMHIAESREELQLLCDGTGPFRELLEERSMWDAKAIPHGSTPFDYVTMLANAPRALIIHGNYLDDDELQFLATHRDRLSLVYCPRTHAYFEHDHYPLKKALELGVRVAMGTDSRASNPDLNLLTDMRFAARAHPSVAPDEILRIATLAGAEALGLENEVGSITPGKLANLVAIPLTSHPISNANDALESIVAGDSLVTNTWFRGMPSPPVAV